MRVRNVYFPVQRSAESGRIVLGYCDGCFTNIQKESSFQCVMLCVSLVRFRTKSDGAVIRFGGMVRKRGLSGEKTTINEIEKFLRAIRLEDDTIALIEPIAKGPNIVERTKPFPPPFLS